MSFDIKLEDGDFQFGPDGNPEIVERKEKLRQEIAKIMETSLGDDPGSPQYGSKVPQVLGGRFDFNILQTMVGKSVAEAVNFLQSLQLVQSTKQEVDFEEVIGSIDAISVTSPSRGKIDVQLAVTTIGGLRTMVAVRMGE